MPGSPLTREEVLAHWLDQGLPAEDAEHFLANPPEGNVFYGRSDGTSVAFTLRACDDVARIEVRRHNCRTCARATPGKEQYHDPEFFCDGRLNPGETKKGRSGAVAGSEKTRAALAARSSNGSANAIAGWRGR